MKIISMIYTFFFMVFMAIATFTLVIIFSPVLLLPNYMRYGYSEFMVNFMTIFMNNVLLMMNIRIIGKDNVDKKRTTLYICNHQSWVDIPLFMSNCRCPVISKKEIKSVPLLGIIATEIGTIFFDRAKTSARIALIKESTAVFRKGHSICLFPEGTRSIDGNLNEPNMALIKLCYKLGVCVVPAAIHGSINVMRKHTHCFNPLKKVVLKYQPPVKPGDYENIEDFSNACWEKVKSTHDEIKNNYFPEKK